MIYTALIIAGLVALVAVEVGICLLEDHRQSDWEKEVDERLERYKRCLKD